MQHAIMSLPRSLDVTLWNIQFLFDQQEDVLDG